MTTQEEAGAILLVLISTVAAFIMVVEGGFAIYANRAAIARAGQNRFIGIPLGEWLLLAMIVFLIFVLCWSVYQDTRRLNYPYPVGVYDGRENHV